MNNQNIKKYTKYLLLLLGGLLLGWIFFHNSPGTEDTHDHASETEQNEIWTCSMHPQIRMDEPGDCPICGMDLIPLSQSTPDSAMLDPDAIHLTNEAAALANVMTSTVTQQKPVKEVRLYGKVQADERLLQSQVAHLSGRIERLFVNFTGQEVKAGQALAEIYSPELITAQQELIEAASIKDQQPEIYQAARERLLQAKLTERQINEIENSGKLKTNFTIYSNTSGIVIARRVNSGDHVVQGSPLFDIADLSKVWVMFDAYESDLPYLNIGDKINFTVQALPGQEFTGSISFIDPVVDAVNRVSKVRVEINNKSGKLKPEMFVTGILKANMEQFTDNFVIPRSAVLWTGKRSIVYVKQPDVEEPIFKMREITIGPTLGNSYIVLEGLSEGEEIVTQGTFNVDAAAQLEGKPSMMNPTGGAAASSMPGMDHGTTGNASTDESHANHEVADQKNSAGASSAAPKSTTPNSTTPSTTLKNQAGKSTVSEDFKKQLGKVTDQYIAMKNALVQSDAKKAKAAANELSKAMDNVNMSLVKGADHNYWMESLGKMKAQVKTIASSDKIDSQRKAFSPLSETLYHVVKKFGLADKTVYYQYCPMANSDKGAFWLSEIKDIRNPYFGDRMLTCGETRETLK